MHWNNVIKEKISWCFAALSFFGGWGITIAGFCVHPVGEIHPTVIVIFGQAMMITGAIIGINLRLRNGDSTLLKNLTSAINETIEKKFRENESSDGSATPERERGV